MNTLFLDQRYADGLAPYLEGYVLKSSNPYKANFRCPVCGDSQKSRSKKRGWILQATDGDRLVFNCFNCHAPLTFGQFMESVDPAAYTNYDAERKREYLAEMGLSRKPQKTETAATTTKPCFKVTGAKEFLKKISTLPVTHPVRRYVVEVRKIPSNQHFRIFYCQDFTGWINSIMPGKLPAKKDPRLVLPIRDADGKMIGVSARTLLQKCEPRYINIMFDESRPKTFGFDVVDFTKPYYVVEGAMDSFFLPNCVAMNGSAIDLKILPHLENATFVLDNQCRDVGVIRTMEKLIDAGVKLVVWPDSPADKMDINKMVQLGQDHMAVIRDNTFFGMKARNELGRWRRI